MATVDIVVKRTTIMNTGEVYDAYRYISDEENANDASTRGFNSPEDGLKQIKLFKRYMNG